MIIAASFPKVTSLPVSSGTFPVGTIVVPMDDKQVDRIHVYGFIHEFLRNNPGSEVARIIEPPSVVLQTDSTPAGAIYQGGPFLIDSSLAYAVNAMLANSTFSKVTTTDLTASFSSNQVFFIQQPSQILVISDGYWGKTYLTLGRMGISYTQVSTAQVMADPSMINQYNLVVLDSPGWYGNPSAYTPPHRMQINAVYSTIQTWVAAGNDIMFTDAAIFDLNSTFPGYVQLGNPGETGSWKGTVYSPPNGFDSEFQSQYYNPGQNPNQVTIFTEYGVGNWVPNAVQPANTGDVRVLMDTTDYGSAPNCLQNCLTTLPHADLAFYFPYGTGIVEGLALQPYEQLYPTYADYNGYYAAYQLYGNQFVEGPTSQAATESPASALVTPMIATVTTTSTSTSTQMQTNSLTTTSTSVAAQFVTSTTLVTTTLTSPSTAITTTTSTSIQPQPTTSTVLLTSALSNVLTETMTTTYTSIQPQTSIITTTTGVALTTVTSTSQTSVPIYFLSDPTQVWILSALFLVIGGALLFRFRSRLVRKPITCPKCGNENPAYADRFCVKCGEPLSNR